MGSYARRLASAMLGSARLAPPSGPPLVTATLAQLPLLLPHSHPISGYRQRTIEERNLIVKYQPPIVPEHDAAAPRAPAECYLEQTYPFEADPQLRKLYCGDRRGTTVNIGLFLEDFDTFAADIAARHCGLHDKRLVTASVERLCWMPEAMQTPQQRTSATDYDMHMAGQVTWVGRSSMEVTVELLTSTAPAAGPDTSSGVTCSGSGSSNQSWLSSRPTLVDSAPGVPRRDLLAVARFLMAARDPSMKKAMAVPLLLPSTAAEKLLFEQGQERQRVRTQRRTSAPAPATYSSHISLVSPAEEAVLVAAFMARQYGLPLVPQDLQRTQADSGGDPGHSSVHTETTCSSCEAAAATLPMEGNLNSAPATPMSSDSQGCSEAMPASGQPVPQPNKVEALVSTLAEGCLPGPCAAGLMPSAIPMPRTEVRHTCLSRHEDRNTTDTLFGGQALRLGYEVSLATARRHAGGASCNLLALEDVAFLAPIPIGATMHVTAHVAYASGPEMRVALQIASTNAAATSDGCSGNNPEGAAPKAAGTPVTTHRFACVFERQDAKPVPLVWPTNLQELDELMQARHQHCSVDVLSA